MLYSLMISFMGKKAALNALDIFISCQILSLAAVLVARSVPSSLEVIPSGSDLIMKAWVKA